MTALSLGEAAAIVTSVLWALTAIAFTSAARKIGAWPVNFARLPLAVMLLSAGLLIATGSPWPMSAGIHEHVWLGLSGITGLTLGDMFLFTSFTMIGPRRSLLVMSTAPVVTVISAWILLGEHLGPMALTGIGIISAGVALASSAGNDGDETCRDHSPATIRRGFAAAFLGAAGQGLGATFAKAGMHVLDPLPATLIRMAWATVALVLLTTITGRLPATLAKLRNRAAWPALGTGIVIGPVLGVWLSLVAIKNAEAGVAQALIGTTPITILVPSWLAYHDRPRPVAIAGALVAVLGGVLLFIR